MKILVVDDSATMRRIVIRALSDMGYQDIVDAEYGQVAFDAFQKGGIGLIITDWNMPVLNGVDLVSQVRVLSLKVPILMVTTNAANTDVIQALKAGASSSYIVKPFTVDSLKAKIVEITGD